MNPPDAAGACGGSAAGACGTEKCSPLSIDGCRLSDCSGSSCAGMLAPWLANILVNAPGSDCGAGGPSLGSENGEDCAAGSPGLSAAADENWEGGVDPPLLDTGLENILVNSPGPDFGAAATGALETGALAAGETGLENIRVNSPGPDCPMGAPGLSAAADETGESGAGVGETGLFKFGAGACADSLEALAPIELNIRVNAPGAPDPVDAPGFDSETWEVGAGETGLLPIVEIPTVGSSGGFSIVTGLKTRATSFVRPSSGAFDGAFELARASAPGIVRACSMRVNSPGLLEASGPAGDDGADSFTGSFPTGTGGCASGVANAGLGGSASAAFFSGVAGPSNEASKSSSARGAAGTCPKTPVALDG